MIYAADGTTLLADLHPPGYQHYYEPLSDIGTLLPEAVISIEDRNFYQEPGVDPQGVVRATMIDWRAHSSVEGASTITQQLAKLRLVGNAPTIDRKIREALLAFEIERHFTKPQILEMYLNSVFFGDTAWGTKAASQIYFHKQTKDLDLAQASMLAGIIKGPTLYSPLLNWTSAKNRQHDVLQAMLRDGKITAEDAAKAFAEDISPPSHMFLPTNTFVAVDFVRYTTDQLIKQFGSDVTYGGGLHVITTLNVTLQNLAQSAVSGNIARLAYRNVKQGALVAIDPTNGAIVSMVGSANPNADGGQYNLAVWPPRNPGSSMKIFTYTAAIASGKYSMTTPIVDGPFSYSEPGWTTGYTAEELRRPLSRHLPAAGVHGQLFEHPCRQGRARRRRLERGEHGAADGRAAVPAALRRERQPGLHHGRPAQHVRALADPGRVRRDAASDGDRRVRPCHAGHPAPTVRDQMSSRATALLSTSTSWIPASRCWTPGSLSSWSRSCPTTTTGR